MSGALYVFVLVWLVMMAAMMLPSSVPMIGAYGGMVRLRRQPHVAARSGLFVGGYLVAWTLFGLAAYAVHSLAGSGMVWDPAARAVAGAVILVAAAYELTPLKYACLSRCRSPLSFVASGWRDGPTGAVRMGMAHGAWCAGCCWALMATLLVLGAMNLAWMVMVALLVAGEKLLPSGRAATLGAAALLTGLAVIVVLG